MPHARIPFLKDITASYICRYIKKNNIPKYVTIAQGV